MAQTTTKKLSVFPGNLVPGAALAAEYWQVSNTTGATATTVDLTFDLVNKYDQIPAISGTPLLTPGTGSSTGSSTTKIVAWYVKTQTKSQIVVTVEVDQAAGTAGSGKDNTVTMCAYIAGPQA
jgi:hypothetical protein